MSLLWAILYVIANGQELSPVAYLTLLTFELVALPTGANDYCWKASLPVDSNAYDG